MPTAYIQAGAHHGFLSPACLETARDLKNHHGYRVIPFDSTRLPKRITPDTPVKGSTGFVRYLYERDFNTTFPNIDIPPPLLPFARRKVTPTTLGELRARVRASPNPAITARKIFIKPLHHAKDFDGGVLYYRATDTPVAYLPDDYPVLEQEVLCLYNEQRFMVGPRSVTAIGPTRDPDLHREARRMHKAWKHMAPRAYVLDVAFARYQRKPKVPTLVEVNSILTAGWSYPCNNPGKLLIAAWKSYAHYAEHGTFR